MAFKLKHFTVESFNRDVNQSGDLLRKYTDWSSYRAGVSAMINQAFTYHPNPERALVLAAGNLNDIDLRFLCNKLPALTLSDADVDAMRRGIDRQGLTAGERAKIETLQADYTGVEHAGLFKALEALVVQTASAQTLADHMQAALHALAHAPVQPAVRRYPLVISCPVYTQLLFTQIEVFLRLLYEAQLYDYADLNLILNAAYDAMPGLLMRYNTLLLNACQPDGLIVLLSDMVEMEAGSRVYRDVSKAAHDGRISARDADVLIKAHGSELSGIGLQDFEKRTQTLSKQYLLWPFDESKSYLVSAVLARPKAVQGLT